MYQYGYNPGNISMNGGGGTVTPPPSVPKVADSSISLDHATGIIVTWDQPMQLSSKLQDAISVKVNGADAVVSKVMLEDAEENTMGIEFTPAAADGDTVTWAYNDQHATEWLKSKQNIEADNQTYTAKVIGGAIPKIPGVIVSRIYSNNGHRIIVEWDRAMHGNADTHLNIAVTKNGQPPLLPKAVMFSGTMMMITLNTPAVFGDTYEWNFQSTNPGAILADVHGTMATDDVHQVTNEIPDSSSDEPFIDLDGDGLEDRVIYDNGEILVTVDDDSYQADLNGDGIVDVVIDKVKKLFKKG